MLRAAIAARGQGIDVYVGQLTVRGLRKPQIQRINALLDKLESPPVRTARANADQLNEFDLQKALQRKPVLLVTNKPVPRLGRSLDGDIDRWIDTIEMLLQAGIDVWATIHDQPARARQHRPHSNRSAYAQQHLAANASLP